MWKNRQEKVTEYNPYDDEMFKTDYDIAESVFRKHFGSQSNLKNHKYDLLQLCIVNLSVYRKKYFDPDKGKYEAGANDICNQTIVNELLLSAIDKSKGDFICLNGATTTMEQAEIFSGSGIKPLDSLIVLSASDELCRERAEKRVVCEDCRSPFQIDAKLTRCVLCNGILVSTIEHIKRSKVKTLEIGIDRKTTRQETCKATTDFLATNFDI